MRRDGMNYLLVGVFVTVLGVAFLLVMLKLTGTTGPADEYHVYFENVTGLRFGTPVFYEGYPVGQIEEMEPEQKALPTRYRLRVSVKRAWRIPDDSVAAIQASGLLGRRVIDIAEGESGAHLQPGSEIKSREQVDLFAAVNRAATTFQEIAAIARPFVDRLDTTLETLSGELIGLTRDDIRPLIRKLEESYTDPEIFGQLKRLLSQLNDSTEMVQDLLAHENRENISSFLANLNIAADNLNGLITRIESTRQEMSGVLNELGALAGENREDLRGSVEDLRKTLRTVSGSIDSTVYHLEGSSRNMHEFTRQIRENPSLLIRGSPQPEIHGEAQ
jgi:phospholipid/cholesterol/gamma-HCH transport system substrate-binding protein